MKVFSLFSLINRSEQSIYLLWKGEHKNATMIRLIIIKMQLGDWNFLAESLIQNKSWTR